VERKESESRQRPQVLRAGALGLKSQASRQYWGRERSALKQHQPWSNVPNAESAQPLKLSTIALLIATVGHITEVVQFMLYVPIDIHNISRM
jgi:hypothetical protein